MQNTVKKKRINFFIARAIILVLPILFQAQISVAFTPQKMDKIKTAYSTSGCKLQVQNNAHNPVIWADFPDPSVIRVKDTYCMSNITVHFCSGLSIMNSKDLVNWEMVVYVYQRLEENDETNLQNGKNNSVSINKKFTNQ
jgi:hypothetical protein